MKYWLLANRGKFLINQSCAVFILCLCCLKRRWFQIATKKFLNYLVYDDGRVYSYYSNKFLSQKPDNLGYVVYHLYDSNIGQNKAYKAHRLVMMLFCPTEGMENLQINHIDGVKTNNVISNLEWCTAYYNNKHARDTGLNNISKSNSLRWLDEDFRTKTSQHISQNCHNDWHNNPRFRYEIYLKDGAEISRVQLKDILHVAQSTADTWIREAGRDNKYSKRLINEGITVIDTKQKM
nr:MAG TPA: homing endonuclease [Caudoviricetes sp.]